jgi:peptidoglycan/LPS O-acetylase OafA/YrhL
VPERLDVLDGLRGFAILLVVWYHAWLVSGQPFGALSFLGEAGFLGVELFFFVSGFCLFHPYARAARDGRADPPVARFFLRRAQKIVPSYLLALLVFASLYPDRLGAPPDALMQIFTHLTFLHTLNQATFGAISGPLWTIGIEVQFYCIFPLIAPAFRRNPWLTYVALLAVAETYRVTIGASDLGSSFWWINQLPAFLDIFGAGMLAAHGVVAWRTRAAGAPRFATAASLAACALAVAGLALTASVYRAGSDTGHDWLNAHRIAIGPLCALIAVSTTFAAARWRGFVAMPPLAFLSTISYNLYLWHLEITVWVQRAGLSPFLTFATAAAGSLAVATAITYLLERPILAADLNALLLRRRPAKQEARRPARHDRLAALRERPKAEY